MANSAAVGRGRGSSKVPQTAVSRAVRAIAGPWRPPTPQRGPGRGTQRGDPAHRRHLGQAEGAPPGGGARMLAWCRRGAGGRACGAAG